MKNKQTAVDWLDRWFRDNPEATHEEGNKALKQAKQMEKEQIIRARQDGIDIVLKGYAISHEEYYKETYGDDT